MKEDILTPKKKRSMHFSCQISNSKDAQSDNRFLNILPYRFTSTNSSSTSQWWIPIPHSRIDIWSSKSSNGTVTSPTQSCGSRCSIQIAQKVSTGSVEIHADSIDSFSDSWTSGNESSRHSVYFSIFCFKLKKRIGRRPKRHCSFSTWKSSLDSS